MQKPPAASGWGFCMLATCLRPGSTHEFGAEVQHRCPLGSLLRGIHRVLLQAKNARPFARMAGHPVVYVVGVGALGVHSEAVAQGAVVHRGGDAGADGAAVLGVYVAEEEELS